MAGQSRGDSVQDAQFEFNELRFVKLVINYHLAVCIKVILFSLRLSHTICYLDLEK